MGVKVREKPKGSGIYWIFINHQGRRKSKKIGMDEKLANKVAEKIKAKLVETFGGVISTIRGIAKQIEFEPTWSINVLEAHPQSLFGPHSILSAETLSPGIGLKTFGAVGENQFD